MSKAVEAQAETERPTQAGAGLQHPRVVLVGNPNVGKSALFNALTGTYVTVSNYPGTTVGVSHGRLRFPEGDLQVIDTPGMYTLNPITEEERVARHILFEDVPQHLVHVVDAKNLRRMLWMTFALLEAGFDLSLTLNMMDEAESLGVCIDVAELSRRLGIEVWPTVALSGRGVAPVREGLHRLVRSGR